MTKVRLYCFPFGGAGASVYRNWATRISEMIEIIPMQFPGREERFRDEPLEEVGALVRDLCGRMDDSRDGPLVFLGHSLGALVAFELARYLRGRDLRYPRLLFVSGCPAPHLPRCRPLISHLGRSEFISRLASDFDLSREIRNDPRLLEYAYPVLRADFAAVESYVYIAERPLDSHIVGLGGDSDIEVSRNQLVAWERHSTQPVEVCMFPGGHFFLTQSSAILPLIERQISTHISG
jgi:surfactin synthase thioesterase subunit